MNVAAVPLITHLTRWRGSLAWLWAIALALYLLAMQFATERQAIWLADGSWTLAAALACVACFRAARRVEPAVSGAWQLLGWGCLSWLTGQLHWDHARLIQGIELPFPSVAHVFYTGFAVFMLLAMRRFPRVRDPVDADGRQVGNIAVVTLCLAVILVLGMVGPALRAELAPVYLWGGLMHTVVVTAAFLVALHAMWRAARDGRWPVMLLLVVANGLYVLSNIIYAHALLTGSYLPTDLVNIGWLAMFGLVACAAHEQVWLVRHPGAAVRTGDHWLQTLVPAVLVIIMAIVAVSSAATLTPVVVSWAVAMFVVLALLLGTREAWMQRDCRELTARLQEIAAQLPAVAPRSSDVRLAEAITQFHRHVVSHRAPPVVPPGMADTLMDERDGSHANERSVQLLATQLQHYLHVRAAQFQRRIERNQLHMSAVIDDVLRYYSRCESLETRLMTVDVSSLVAQTVSSLQRDIGSIDFQVQFEREPFLLHSPAGELSMVLILRELLHNAWKFTRTVATPTVSIECVRECGQVVLTVRDNGIGFDMRHQSRLFQPFQWLQVAPGCRGVGLGLALASRAVQRMGGTVRVSQQSCAGACFVVELPDFAALSTQRPLQRSIVHGGALRGYR